MSELIFAKDASILFTTSLNNGIVNTNNISTSNTRKIQHYNASVELNSVNISTKYTTSISNEYLAYNTREAITPGSITLSTYISYSSNSTCNEFDLLSSLLSSQINTLNTSISTLNNNFSCKDIISSSTNTTTTPFGIVIINSNSTYIFNDCIISSINISNNISELASIVFNISFGSFIVNNYKTTKYSSYNDYIYILPKIAECNILYNTNIKVPIINSSMSILTDTHYFNSYGIGSVSNLSLPKLSTKKYSVSITAYSRSAIRSLSEFINSSIEIPQVSIELIYNFSNSNSYLVYLLDNIVIEPTISLDNVSIVSFNILFDSTVSSFSLNYCTKTS